MVTNNLKIDVCDDKKEPWLNIEHTVLDDGKSFTLIGMYECGVVARHLFTMNEKQLEQLYKTLEMLVKK